MVGRIVYIAGYGRSGSTLLSVMLDRAVSAVAVGELAGLSKFLAAGSPVCSCGRRYARCPIWSRVLERMPEGTRTLAELGVFRRRMEAWNGPWLWWRVDGVRERYRQLMKRLLDAVLEVTGAEVIVDASKSAFSSMWRGRTLGEVVGADVFVIHLVRRPSRVMSSCRKGRNVDLERGRVRRSGLLGASMGLGGWCGANLAAKHVRRWYGEGRSTVVRFEDLLDSPSRELQRICDEAGLDIPYANAPKVGDVTFGVGHLVGANRMARNHDAIEVRGRPAKLDPAGHLERVVASTIEPRLLELVTGA